MLSMLSFPDPTSNVQGKQNLATVQPLGTITQTSTNGKGGMGLS